MLTETGTRIIRLRSAKLVDAHQRDFRRPTRRQARDDPLACVGSVTYHVRPSRRAGASRSSQRLSASVVLMHEMLSMSPDLC